MTRRNGTGPSKFTVAVIGGGFTGATLVAQLLQQAAPSFSVALIERDSRPGCGVAYGTQHPFHLLNVPADNMSAVSGDPEHFLRWARLNFDSGAQPEDYLPRRVYGQYLQSVLHESAALKPDQFDWKHDEAVRITRHGSTAEISLRSGEKILADKVVLALGNFPPGDLPIPGKPDRSPRYVPDPWAADAMERIPHQGSVLLVGSGLTAVDVVLALRANEFRGTIHILSRHGLLPQKHQAAALPWPPFLSKSSPRTVRGLMRLVRQHVQAAQTHGNDWRYVIDSLRPFTQAIWQSLPVREQQRFLRHLRAYWDSHRHRVAPDIGAILHSQLLNGRVQAHAGRITAYHETANAVAVTYRERKTGELKQLGIDRVFNCTGPEADCRKLASPLLRDLTRQHLIRPDQVFLGLDTAGDGALIGSDGKASDFLYTLGPTRKGSLWETIAVPEIRVQVSALTSLLTGSSELNNEPGSVGTGVLARPRLSENTPEVVPAAR
jgi:uncharacterized NAD(P)/FAD-binding protein YdhS